MFKLELKTTDDGYKASKKQTLNLRRWKNAGAVVGVVYSMKVIKSLFKKDWNEPCFKSFEEPNNCESWYEIPERRT